MYIAIPTNDRKTVAEKSGQAKEFVVIEYDNGNIISKKYLDNDHLHFHKGTINKNSKVFDYSGGKPSHGHDDLVQLLNGVNIIIGKKFGPHFARDFHAAGVKLVLTKLDLIEETLQDID